MSCLCERMYPNYAVFCQQTGFGDGQIYRRILDLIWETLTVKDAKVHFDSQLEKLEEAIPSADDFDLYGVYPAIDACVALSAVSYTHLDVYKRQSFWISDTTSGTLPVIFLWIC